MQIRKVLLAFTVGLLAAGCATSMGPHDFAAMQATDFGPPVTVKICALLDEGITPGEARELLAKAWAEDGPRYGVSFTIAHAARWQRPGFTVRAIMGDVARYRLRPPCDRILALVGRHAGDMLWGIMPISVDLGGVNTSTSTHGFVVARLTTATQWLTPPKDALNHELHHMLGCHPHFNMAACYPQIMALKRAAAALGGAFFPGWNGVDGLLVRSHDEVNATIAKELRGELVPARPVTAPLLPPRD